VYLFLSFTTSVESNVIVTYISFGAAFYALLCWRSCNVKRLFGNDIPGYIPQSFLMQQR
jgi:hypothetical protein